MAGVGRRAEEGNWRQAAVGAGLRRRTGRQAMGHRDRGKPVVVKNIYVA